MNEKTIITMAGEFNTIESLRDVPVYTGDKRQYMVLDIGFRRAFSQGDIKFLLTNNYDTLATKTVYATEEEQFTKIHFTMSPYVGYPALEVANLDDTIDIEITFLGLSME